MIKSTPLLLALMLGFSGQSAHAQVALWDRAVSGVTLEQLRATYPNMKQIYRSTYILLDRIEPFKGCPAQVTAVLYQGLLDQIIWTGEPEILEKCFSTVRSQMASKYGPTKLHGNRLIWQNNGLRIMLRSEAYTPRIPDDGPIQRQWLVIFSSADAASASATPDSPR